MLYVRHTGNMVRVRESGRAWAVLQDALAINNARGGSYTGRNQ